MYKFDVHYCGEVGSVYILIDGVLSSTAFTVGFSGGTLAVSYSGCLSSVTADSALTYSIDDVNQQIIFTVPTNYSEIERTFNFSVKWCDGSIVNAVINQKVNNYFLDEIVAPSSGGTFAVEYIGCLSSITVSSSVSYVIDSSENTVYFTVPANTEESAVTYDFVAHWCDGSTSNETIKQATMGYKMLARNYDSHGDLISTFRVPCSVDTELTVFEVGSGRPFSSASIEIGACVERLGDGLFSNGNGGYCDIKSAYIPDNVTYIGNDVFEACSGLTSVTLSNRASHMGSYVFSRCYSLPSITIPGSISGVVYEAFSYCTGLTSVTINNGVTNIGDYAFWHCSGLTSVVLPESINRIDICAFQSCTSLQSVTVLATTPPYMHNGGFGDTNDCPIYVPAESVEAYKNDGDLNHHGWRQYASRIFPIPNS